MRLRNLLVLSSVALVTLAGGAAPAQNVEFCSGGSCPGKNSIIKNYRVLHQQGSRPRWSPDGRMLVFDRVNADGFFDIYLSEADGTIIGSLTDGRPGIGQRSNGNADFHPSGESIVFVSEAEEHFLGNVPSVGDSGIGLFSNLWVTDQNGAEFRQLTEIPIKKSILDRTPVMATVNPVFVPTGSQIVWTERYDGGGNLGWGLWRLKTAEWVSVGEGTSLANERVLFQPSTGNYVTALGSFDSSSLLLAANLDGQHEFAMDNYTYDLSTGAWQNYQNTPQYWEEGACVSPNAEYLVFMSNSTSSRQLDFEDPDWASQPTEREYWLTRADHAGQPQRLTFLNDASAPEYLGHRVITASCDFSPDGRYLAGTLGVDFGQGNEVKLQLKTFLIEFSDPTMFSGSQPILSEGSVVSGASFAPGLTASGWTSIFGAKLASSTREWAAEDFVNGRLPTELEGISVKINGKAAPISFVSPSQLNVLAPADDAVGPVNVEVTNAAGGTASTTATKRSLQPAFFHLPQRGGRYAAAVHPDGTLIGPPNLIPGVTTRPVKPGDIVLLFGTGFGPTDPPTPTDVVVAAPARLANNASIQIGGATAQIQFAGIVTPGLYQFNVVVPSVPAGDHSVTAQTAGVSTGLPKLITVQ